ncbi:MAG TPA: hypothetical protein VK978_05375 [Candidatus Saccharimonadales bacterium]|nr:hypothetical protein [Candidatus Saccharimonadales bacterium]
MTYGEETPRRETYGYRDQDFEDEYLDAYGLEEPTYAHRSYATHRQDRPDFGLADEVDRYGYEEYAYREPVQPATDRNRPERNKWIAKRVIKLGAFAFFSVWGINTAYSTGQDVFGEPGNLIDWQSPYDAVQDMVSDNL